MFKIITKRKEWNGVLEIFKEFDFYHTYDYHHTSKRTGEEPILIQYCQGDKNIALPLLLRNIEGTEYKDATSVYGYAGPLSNNIDRSFDNKAFREQLHNLFRTLNIISVFSRLHPFISAQKYVLSGMGKICDIGHTVNIDLTLDPNSQKQAYQKRLRTYINKSRRVYSVKKADTETEVLKFIELYYENMRRVDADSNYFFENDYFFNLIESTEFKTEILLAKPNGSQEYVAGAMFVKEKNIVQYHLSGAKEEYLYLNPIKLLIDEARTIAFKENYTYFNLGGGKGGLEDSLFQFKAGFSRNLWMFRIWKYIVDQKIYDDLVNKRLKNVTLEKRKEYLAYFPHYRCNR